MLNSQSLHELLDLGAMDTEDHKLKGRRLGKWLKKNNRRADANFYWNEIFSDNDEVDDDEIKSSDEAIAGSRILMKADDPCISNSELRIFVGTWNVAGRSPVGSLAVDLDEWFNLKDAADIYVLGFQEIVPLKTRYVIGAEDQTEATNWNLLIGKTLNDKYDSPWLTPMLLNPISSDQNISFPRSNSRSLQDHKSPLMDGSKYKLMASRKMVGVFISVWMKNELLRKYTVSDVKVSSVACGIMGYLGNKGSVAVSMCVEGTNLCFVAAHLASGEKKGDEGRRNHQVAEIFRRTCFSRSSKDDHNPSYPLTILGHDWIFWFGDLNYRLYLEDSLARHLIQKEDWKGLQEFDQLRTELEDGGVFQGWKEGNIEFAPTYKYSNANCNQYSGGLPNRAGDKPRTPAWCDRIIWHGKGVKQLSYVRSESKFSDHRPVSALFSLPIEVMKTTGPRISSIVLNNSPETKVSSSIRVDQISTLQSLLSNYATASPTRKGIL